MTGRRQARELALQGLYAFEIHKRDIGEIFDQVAQGNPLGEKHLQYARRLMETVVQNLEFVDQEISRLAENWDLERIALIDRIILRMALTEIHFMPDIPEKVAINEAIDLAKEYSTIESSSFVNGILDAALIKSRRPADS
jgi:N utilization substance protein B